MQYINTWFRASKISLSILALTCFLAGQVQAKLNESDVLPDLSTFEMTGELPDLEGKVILLDFWASWCTPCKASFPAMDEIYTDYKDRGLVILAVSVDSTEKAYRSFADKSAVSFPLVHDQAKKLVSTAEIEAMPTSFLIDKKGVIRSIHKGYQGKKTIANYREEIETLLAE